MDATIINNVTLFTFLISWLIFMVYVITETFIPGMIISKIKKFLVAKYRLYKLRLEENSTPEKAISNSKRLREYKNEEKSYY